MKAEGGLDNYPGSPLIVRNLLRKQDRLSAIELHPENAKTLAAQFEDDLQTRVIKLDGGLALVDPLFETGGEFDRLVDGLKKADRHWPGSISAL